LQLLQQQVFAFPLRNTPLLLPVLRLCAQPLQFAQPLVLAEEVVVQAAVVAEGVVAVVGVAVVGVEVEVVVGVVIDTESYKYLTHHLMSLQDIVTLWYWLCDMAIHS